MREERSSTMEFFGADGKSFSHKNVDGPLNLPDLPHFRTAFCSPKRKTMGVFGLCWC